MRFDNLYNVNSDELKRMAHTFGGSGALRKAECVDFMERTLNDPARLRVVAEHLESPEYNALALAKIFGGVADVDVLTAGLCATGVVVSRDPRRRSWGTQDLIRPLIHRGLFLSTNPGSPTYLPDYGSRMIFSDERLLEHIGAPKITPLALPTHPAPPQTLMRRPALVSLDLVRILQSIETLGGIGVTQQGAPRVGDVRKWTRALGWQDDTFTIDGLTFPDAPAAFIGALEHGGLLNRAGGAFHLNVSVQKFAARSYADQVRPFWLGFLMTRPWMECRDPHKYYFNAQYHPAGRMALSIALAALPTTSDGFLDVNALSAALFERIGEFFALDYPPQPPYYFRDTPDEIAHKEKERWEKLRTDWDAEERVWIAHALTTWLYFLGIVEIGVHNRLATHVRLTELGRALFHPETTASPHATAPSTTAWVVQPNFEIVVYLDAAIPPQLALLEQYAERLKTQEHTAHYRLTRETVYQGLERGGALDALVTALQNGSTAPLPANVLTELREWNARRKKITLVRRAHLLEFENEIERDDALVNGLEGARVGERFVLATRKREAEAWSRDKIDYTARPTQNLRVTEKGKLHRTITTRDLLFTPYLERWAERVGENKWQLTRERVSAAVRAGAQVNHLLNWLEARLTHTLSPLLAIALRLWAGERANVQFGRMVVLRCTHPRVMRAIVESETFKPFIHGRLGEDVLWLESALLPEFQNELAWLGLRLTEEADIEPLESPET